jgi:hypothetical protein
MKILEATGVFGEEKSWLASREEAQNYSWVR